MQRDEVQLDNVTSLPLSHSLLTFYRERLKDAVQKTTAEFNKQLKLLRPDIDHVHEVELSVSASGRALDALQDENDDLRNLLKEVIEENAKLRLNRAPHSSDQSRTDRLLHSISQRPHERQDHSQILTSIVDRCQALENLATNTLAELNIERAQRENVEMKLVECEETLRYNTNELMGQLKHYESQPSLEDFEFVKSQVEQLRLEREADRRELDSLRAGNLRKCSNEFPRTGHSAHDRLRVISGNQQRYKPFRYEKENDDGDESVLESEVDKMVEKLKSLERFADKFMPEEVHGVPEFLHTVEKSKSRVEDIEARLAKRMQARRQKQ